MASSVPVAHPPWREAASLIVVARASLTQKVGQSLAKSLVVSSRVVREDKHKAVASQSSAIAKTDYRLLMVKRSGLSSFMASAFVFPGGAVEIADYSNKWWPIFQSVGVTPETLISKFVKSVAGPRPPMVTDPLTIVNARNSGNVSDEDLLNLLPADVALRISAIRETFEETGVLLLTNPNVKSDGRDASSSDSELINNDVDLSSWREKVRKDASSFIDLCRETGLCPDLWSLYEWSNWLTPISVGHKRFDTAFYLCCLEKQPKVVLDHTEVTTLKWCTPIEMLEEHVQERVFLAPPQVYELSRIHHLSNFAAVREFSSSRNELGNDRWLPVLATYRDGAISFLPGDSMYPNDPDVIGKKPVPDYPQSVLDIRSQSSELNRIELRGPTCMSFCNIKLPYGHLTPITYHIPNTPNDTGVMSGGTNSASTSML